MTRIRYTLQVSNDAGLLREYIAHEYGQALFLGGCIYSVYSNAMRLVRRLARLAGLSVESVLADLRADFEAMEDAI